MTKLKDFQINFKNYIRTRDSTPALDIQPGGTLSPMAALDVYAHGYEARLLEMLGDTFEATWWILGDEYFFQLGKEFIQSTSSTYTNIMDYGEGFPVFLKSHFSRLHETPYLTELALFEWKIRTLFHQEDAPLGQSLNSIETPSLAEIPLLLRPTHFFHESLFQITQLWNYRGSDLMNKQKIMSEVHRPECIFIFRQDCTIYMKTLTPWQKHLLESFQAPCSLQNALSEINLELSPQEVQEFFSFIRNSDLLMGT